MRIAIAGGGIYGATLALSLASRGHTVHLFDPGPLPHPAASSTDISKVIRLDYGDDEFYMALMEAAIAEWHTWNVAFGQPLYHPDGVIMMARAPLAPGMHEHDSYQLLLKRGHQPRRLDPASLHNLVPAWHTDDYLDGYYNPEGGWAASGAVVERVLAWAHSAGAALHPGHTAVALAQSDTRITGLVFADGSTFTADLTIIAAGAWSTKLLPHMADRLTVTGQPVWHLEVNPAQFQPPHFFPWAADIRNTGWYGFPAQPSGLLKIANHGLGGPLDPDGPRLVTDAMTAHLRAFLQHTFPSLAAAPIRSTRLCLYCDTWDGDFYLDFDPDHPGLFVATGGSGHGFKFAPLLGVIAADVIEGTPNPWAARFAWRALGQPTAESARWVSA